MAHKTFISYKYSEAQQLRDRIIDSLGQDAQYYQGETSDSPDLTDNKTETIREYLKDMIFGTSVTIVIISPNMTESEWIDWEIEYSLCEYSRQGKASKSNGIVGVVMKVNNGYDWMLPEKTNNDGCIVTTINNDRLYNIIKNNMFNQSPKEYACSTCKCVNRLTGSYISLIPEEEFLANPTLYIDNAYNKCKNVSNYIISKTR